MVSFKMKNNRDIKIIKKRKQKRELYILVDVMVEHNLLILIPFKRFRGADRTSANIEDQEFYDNS